MVCIPLPEFDWQALADCAWMSLKILEIEKRAGVRFLSAMFEEKKLLAERDRAKQHGCEPKISVHMLLSATAAFASTAFKKSGLILHKDTILSMVLLLMCEWEHEQGIKCAACCKVESLQGEQV